MQSASALGVSMTMMNPHRLLILLTFLLLTGCASNSPSPDLQFCKIGDLSELQGSYSNEMDEKQDPSVIYLSYLSQIIWPEFDDLTLEEHQEIDRISISIDSTGKVFAEGYSQGILKISGNPEYIQSLEDGVVPLNSHSTVLPQLDVLVGWHDTRLFLYQDCDRNLVLGRNSVSTGLAYLVIPMHFNSSDSFTFRRLDHANK